MENISDSEFLLLTAKKKPNKKSGVKNTMYILENLSQLEKAANKAKTIKPIVRMIQFGLYAVQGSKGNFYTVECKRNERGEKVVSCECIGASKGLVCWHSASILELHCTQAKHQATV